MKPQHPFSALPGGDPPSPPLSPLELEQATLAALVEHSPDAVIGETLEGLITSWNPGAQRLFGYAAPEVIGRHISLLAPPENPVDMLDIIQRVKTGEVVQRVAAERLRKDGQRILVSLAVCPVRAPNGQVIAIIKLAHDITQRHQAQQALQQSEANLRILFNSAQEGVVLHTVEGAILDVNESWCQLHGVSPEQARRLSIADLSSPAMSMDKARQLWAQALRGEPQFFEWDSRRAGDGSPFDAEIFLRRIQMNGQDVVLASVRDITQRKRAAEQERLQSAALQSAANAVAITGRDGIIQSVNPAFTRLTGYPAQEVLGRNARILKSGLQPAAFYTVMWNTILAGQVWRGELINRRKDGSLYSEDMTITPVRDAGGAISHFIAIKQDVTERKQAELALQRQNRQLSILNAAAQALLATREAETALEVIYDRMAQWFQVDSFVEFGLNAAGDTLELVACKVIAGARQPGISRLALGQWIAGKVAQSRTPMVVANAQASLDPDLQFIRALQANAYACEPLVVGERLLGTLSFGSSSRQSFEPEDQAFFQTLANYIALGKERLRLTRELQQHASRLEETVRERTAQLLEANANLQTFADTAAHDLRSPLRSIKVFSSIAADEYGPQLGAEGHALLQKVVQATDQMAQLLNDLLEYSRLSQAELRLERVDLGTAVEAALRLLQEDLRHQAAEVTVESPLPPILGHPATVTLVLTNFLSNALKFMPPGVSPRIRIWAEPVEPSTLNSPLATRFVRLRVQDNGIGIEPRHQEKLFQLFQRLHGKRAYSGTGLGLAIVRRAVERMGGQVGVESQPGKGSCFWAEFRPGA